jgi:hypothetical protein
LSLDVFITFSSQKKVLFFFIITKKHKIMLHSTSANSLLLGRYPASILGRINDSIVLSLRMGAASVHVLAFIILVDNRELLIPHSPYTLHRR